MLYFTDYIINDKAKMLSIINQSEEMMKLFDLKTNHETELLGIDTRP